MKQYTTKDSALFKVGMYVENIFNSNVMNNSVYYNALFKNGISRNSFLKMQPRALNTNIAGVFETDRVYTSWKGTPKESSTFDHFATIGSVRLVNMRFSRDLFTLAGLGNKPLAGQMANANGLNLNLMQYTKFEYGRIYQTPKYSYGAGIGLLMGNKYFNATTHDAYLYTSDIGDSISVRIAGSTIENDTASKLIYDPNGFGMGLDLFFSMPFDLSKNNGYQGTLTFEVNDFGFIAWNKKSISREYDGKFDWPGIKSPSLFEISDSIYKSQIPDTLENQFVRSVEKGAVSMLTPFRISATYSENLTDELELKIMLDYRINANYLPYVALTQNILVKEDAKSTKYYVNIFQSLGGYGYGGLGVGFAMEHNYFGVDIGTRHLLALAVPETLSGVNIRIGFHWNFYSK